MNTKEKKLASVLLDMASSEFGHHGCNDVDEKIYEGWSIEERRALVKAFHEYNGDPQEYDENHLHIPDFALMGFFSDKLEKENQIDVDLPTDYITVDRMASSSLLRDYLLPDDKNIVLKNSNGSVNEEMTEALRELGILNKRKYELLAKFRK